MWLQVRPELSLHDWVRAQLIRLVKMKEVVQGILAVSVVGYAVQKAIVGAIDMYRKTPDTVAAWTWTVRSTRRFPAQEHKAQRAFTKE